MRIYGAYDRFYKSVAEINEDWDPEIPKTYKFKTWAEVFNYIGKIRMEIFEKGSMKITDASKKAFKDPRALAARKQYETFKKKFPKEYNDLLHGKPAQTSRSTSRGRRKGRSTSRGRRKSRSTSTSRGRSTSTSRGRSTSTSKSRRTSTSKSKKRSTSRRRKSRKRL